MQTFEFSLDQLMAYGGVAGSIFSTLLTFYFWLIRSNKERANVRLFLAPTHTKMSLGVNNGDERWLFFEAGIVAANYSSLPNSILDIQVAIRTPRGWQQINHLSIQQGSSLPANLAPMQTALVPVAWAIKFPPSELAESRESPNEIINGYLNEFFGKQCVLRATVTTLGGRHFSSDVIMPNMQIETPNVVLRRAA